MGMNDTIMYNKILFKTGDKIICTIYRSSGGNYYEIKDGTIYVPTNYESEHSLRERRFVRFWDDGTIRHESFYVLQNIISGNSPDNPEWRKFGYKYAWIEVIERWKHSDQFNLGISGLQKTTYNIFQDIALLKET